jgi:hypothetical protein
MANLRNVTPYGTIPLVNAGDIIYAQDWNTITTACRSIHARGMTVANEGGYKDNNLGYFRPICGMAPFEQIISWYGKSKAVKFQKPPGYNKYCFSFEYCRPMVRKMQSTDPAICRMTVGLSRGGNYYELFNTSSTPALEGPVLGYVIKAFPPALSGNYGVTAGMCLRMTFEVTNPDGSNINGTVIELPYVDGAAQFKHYAGFGRVCLTVFRDPKIC